MNCQEVNEILDSLQLDHLQSGKRQQVEIHVATCADCARAWNAQFALASLPDEPMPAALASQCLTAVAARVPAAATGRRRVLIWGSMTAAAAVAATLLLLFQVENQTAPAMTVPASDIESTSRIVEVTTTAQSATAETSTPPLTEALAPVSVREPRITVELAAQAGQERNQTTTPDPFAREIQQSLRSALVDELGKVPNLTVVQGVPEQFAAPDRHYRLQIRPLRMFGVDGRPIRSENLYMNLGVEEVQPSGSIIQHSLPVGFAVDPRATCTDPAEARTKPCDASTTAAFLVRELRQKIFPADASVTQPLQARLRDFSISPDERFQAFVELFTLQGKAGNADLLGDPDVVRAAVELSQLTDAARRAQLWRALRGIGDPLLIDPMLATLQQDPKDARIAAIETLALDFSGNPRVRSALESAATSDPDSLVRGLALRGLNGEGAWQAHVMSSLKEATLPASQRVEALLHVLYPPDTIDGISDGSPSSYWQTLKDLDGAEVEALAEVIPRAEQLRKWPGNNLVGNFAGVHNQNPAVKKMLLTVLEQDTRASNRSVAGEALAQGHVGDPRVRDALAKAVSSDPDASVRDYLKQVLDRDYVKKAIEAATR